MIRHCLTDAEILAAGPVVRGVVEQVEKALTSARYAAQAQPHVLALAKALFLRLRLRDPATGGTYAWEFVKGKRTVVVKARGRLTVSDTGTLLGACLGG